MAREGVPLNFEQAYVFEILVGMIASTPEALAAFARDGVPLRAGEPFSSPEMAGTIERLGEEGSAPFYRGEVAAAPFVEVRSPRLSGLWYYSPSRRAALLPARS